jgi:hypothetical protein
MKTGNLIRSIVAFMGFITLVLPGIAQHAAALSCGPGADWVDSCLSGTDSFVSRADHAAIILDGGGVISLSNLTGITRVFRGNPVGPEPLHIDTEMVSLSLMGGGETLHAGDGIGNLLNDGSLFSPGKITEQGSGIGSTTADSFFDVFFEILGPHPRLHNNSACTMSAVIDRVPPLTNPPTFYHGCSQGSVVLFNDSNQRVGILTGDIIHFGTIPEPSTLLLVGFGLIAFAAVVRTRLFNKIKKNTIEICIRFFQMRVRKQCS